MALRLERLPSPSSADAASGCRCGCRCAAAARGRRWPSAPRRGRRRRRGPGRRSRGRPAGRTGPARPCFAETGSKRGAWRRDSRTVAPAARKSAPAGPWRCPVRGGRCRSGSRAGRRCRSRRRTGRTSAAAGSARRRPPTARGRSKVSSPGCSWHRKVSGSSAKLPISERRTCRPRTRPQSTPIAPRAAVGVGDAAAAPISGRRAAVRPAMLWKKKLRTVSLATTMSGQPSSSTSQTTTPSDLPTARWPLASASDSNTSTPASRHVPNRAVAQVAVEEALRSRRRRRAGRRRGRRRRGGPICRSSAGDQVR